jgi:hypothetical protein
VEVRRRGHGVPILPHARNSPGGETRQPSYTTKRAVSLARRPICSEPPTRAAAVPPSPRRADGDGRRWLSRRAQALWLSPARFSPATPSTPAGSSPPRRHLCDPRCPHVRRGAPGGGSGPESGRAAIAWRWRRGAGDRDRSPRIRTGNSS